MRRKKYSAELIISKSACLFSLVDQLYEQGIYSIQPTVPVGDKEFGNHFIWSNYSEQRLYNRVVAIYQKALIAYNDYVLYWFSAFASRMRMAILMPGVFRVNLTFKEDSSDGPTISWHMEALPETMKNRVFCTQNESEEWQNNLDQLRSTLEKDTINRPNQREWLGWTLHSEALRCFGETPITDVVFNWIENDLKELHWL